MYVIFDGWSSTESVLIGLEKGNTCIKLHEVSILENSRHEAFAQALAQGQTADAAYEAAGYKADRGHASRLASNGNVVARVRELQEATAATASMSREQAVKMCVEILQAPPSSAHLDNPLCELKMGKDGPYAVYPDKKGILDRLSKMLGWDEPEKHDVTLTGPRGVLNSILKRK